MLTRQRVRIMARLDPAQWGLQQRIFELEDDMARAGITPARRDRALEAAAALSGLLGAWLLAAKGDYAGWGWMAFLASNVGWMAFGCLRGLWWMVAMQVGFTGSSLLGIWRWLL